jgi:DNA (cytosine-5)-methyltransferase 1
MATGIPWVIENVAGARRDMLDPVKLSGGMFGLGVDRPRLFESSFPIRRPPKFKRPETVIGIYGRHHDGRRLWTRSDGSILRAARTLEEGRRAMGIDWMEWHELTEAIPPAYTEFIGVQLLLALEVAA